jgi:hypothetical protein
MVFFGIGLAHLTNTGKGKNKNLVDPNVHLLYIYPRHLLGTPSIVMMLKQQDSSCTNNDRQRVVFIETTDTCPNINRFAANDFQSRDWCYGTKDTCFGLQSLPRLQPKVYTRTWHGGYDHSVSATDFIWIQRATQWRIKLIIPSSWALHHDTTKDDDDDEQEEQDTEQNTHRVVVAVVTVTNIWQDAPTVLKFEKK